MADERLDGLKVAILVADGFEEVELTGPRRLGCFAGSVAPILRALVTLPLAEQFSQGLLTDVSL